MLDLSRSDGWTVLFTFMHVYLSSLSAAAAAVAALKDIDEAVFVILLFLVESTYSKQEGRGVSYFCPVRYPAAIRRHYVRGVR